MQTEINKYETYQTGFNFESLGLAPLGGLRGRGRGKKSTFLEYGHAAYKIKEDGVCSIIVADPGMGSNFHFFRT